MTTYFTDSQMKVQQGEVGQQSNIRLIQQSKSHGPVEGRERPLGDHLRPVWFWLSCHVDIWKQNENQCYDVKQKSAIQRLQRQKSVYYMR